MSIQEPFDKQLAEIIHAADVCEKALVAKR